METSPAINNLGTADYVAFIGLLVTSSAIGVFFAIKDRKVTSTKNYYFGGKQMNPVAVGMSIAVTFKSSVAVIAAPAEAYISGTLVFWELIVTVLVVPVTVVYFVPVFHRLQLQTIYEFLELRFSTKLRRLAAAIQTLGAVFYMGIVVYLPAAALNAMTPIPLAWSIVLTGGICTFYTTLGGMKAVIWTDVLQSTIMILGILAVFVRGLYVVGGFEEVFAALERSGRFTEQRFDHGIVSRISPTAMIIGGFFIALREASFAQSIVQRYQSCKTARQAQIALMVYVIPVVAISLPTLANGLIMYAYYEGCDPVRSGKLESIDQGIPYMAFNIFKFAPGMAGLFISAIFSATLSTVSSALNSLSMVILEDFIVTKWPNLSERIRILIGKALVAVLGTVGVSMAFAISAARSNALELLHGFIGLIYGPLTGIYVLGFFFPWANAMGAAFGVLSGFLILAFMFVGKHFLNDDPYVYNLPLVSTGACFSNSTQATAPYTPSVFTDSLLNYQTDKIDRTILRDVYNVNFNFFMFIGFTTAVVVGLAASFISGHTPASRANPSLFIPLIDNKRFPESVRKFFRFGVPEMETKKKTQYTAPRVTDSIESESNEV